MLLLVSIRLISVRANRPGKMRLFRSPFSCREKVRRLNGGGRSLLRTILRGPCRVTGKITGIFLKSRLSWHPGTLTRAEFYGLFLHMEQNPEQGISNLGTGTVEGGSGEPKFPSRDSKSARPCPVYLVIVTTDDAPSARNSLRMNHRDCRQRRLAFHEIQNRRRWHATSKATGVVAFEVPSEFRAIP